MKEVTSPGVAVVTGSSGFIGGHLVRALVERGFEVRCLLRGEAAVGAIPTPRVSWHRIDFSDARTLRETDALDGASHLFHLAGVTRGSTSADFRRGNVLPTENLLGALSQRRAPLDRFVLVSSQAAAGPATALERPCSEVTPAAPVDAYGRSKAEAEGVVERYSGSIPATIVRPPAVYGPGDRDFLALFRMLRWRLSVHAGPRDAFLSLIFIDDLVRGMIDAALAPTTVGATYFLAHPEAVRWSALHALASEIAGRRPLRVDVPHFAVAAAGRLGDLWGRATGRHPLLTSQKALLARPRYWVCSPERARNAFGFEATTPLEEGLRETHRWYREEGWLR